jgi:hypothetical protein
VQRSPPRTGPVPGRAAATKTGQRPAPPPRTPRNSVRKRPPKPRPRRSRDEPTTAMKKAGRSNPNLFKLGPIRKGIYKSYVDSSSPPPPTTLAKRREKRPRFYRATDQPFCLAVPAVYRGVRPTLAGYGLPAQPNKVRQMKHSRVWPSCGAQQELNR